jgi:hypothetical protein
MPSYAHALDAGVSAWFFWYWYRDLQGGLLRWQRYVKLGLLLGLVTMVRLQNILFGILIAAEIMFHVIAALRAKQPWSQRRRIIIQLAGQSMLCLLIVGIIQAPQFYEWKVMFGKWITTPQGPGMVRYGHPMVLEFLFSSRNGWFSITPIAYLGSAGLVAGAVVGPRIAPHARLLCGSLLAAVIVQVYVNAATYDWWGSASFGQRRMCSATLPLIIGLAILLRCGSLLLAKAPRWSKQALAISVLGFLVTWNLQWVGNLRYGRAAGRDNQLPCCNDVVAPVSWIGAPVYRWIGNPFSFPANAWFAWRHDVDIHRWDQSVGNYALVPPFLGYVDGSYRNAQDTWNPFSDARYLLSGWSALTKVATPTPPGPKVFRWTVTSSATLLLPLLLPEPHQITLPIAANCLAGQQREVKIFGNDALLATVAVGATWQMVTFVTQGNSVGETVLRFESSIASPIIQPATAAAPPKPTNSADIGIAVGPLRVGLPH